MGDKTNTAEHHDVFVALLRAVADLAAPGDERGVMLVRRVEADVLELLLHCKRRVTEVGNG